MKKIYFLIFFIAAFKNFTGAQTYTRTRATIKIDSTTDYFHLNDMAVDANGNTYMCGYQVDPGGEYYDTHLLLVKINAQGNFEWKRNFNELRDSIDEAIALKVDTSGFIYVTGRRVDRYCNICTYPTIVSDLITMKYNAAGDRLWLNRFHSGDSILATPSAITLSPDGVILITANEKKYDTDLGTYISKLLVQRINKYGRTSLIKRADNVVGNNGCFDNNNNIIIAAAFDPYHYYLEHKPMLLKYDSLGNLLWKSVFNENNKNGDFYFVNCDANNNIYTNGQTDTIAFNNMPKIITAKYSSAGSRLWFAKESLRTYTLPHVWGDFKIDEAGNSYLTGYISKTDVDDDWLVSKYNSDGKRQWNKTFGDTLGGSDKPIALAVDETGNVFVSGYLYNKDGNYSVATAGYNYKGAMLFSDAFYRRRSNAFAAGIGLDKTGNVYTGGSIGLNNNPYGGYLVIKYAKTIQAFTETKKSNIINDVKLYPNPAVNNLCVDITASLSSKKYSLIISDVSGNVVLLKQLNNTGKEMHTNIDVSNLKTGVYTLNITDGINAVSKTFLKQ